MLKFLHWFQVAEPLTTIWEAETHLRKPATLATSLNAVITRSQCLLLLHNIEKVTVMFVNGTQLIPEQYHKVG